MNEAGAFPSLLSVSQHFRYAFDQVLRCVSEGTYCALIGPRFSGKSELLRSVRNVLSQDPARVCVHVDLQEVQSATQTGFFANLIRICTRWLHEEYGCELPFAAPQSARSAVFRSFLLDCVTNLQRDLVLIIDSLEAIPNDLVLALLTSLRAAYMDQQDNPYLVVVVLSGALSLAQRTVGESSPLRGIAERVLVRELSAAESEQLIEHELATAEVSASHNARTIVLRACEGDPTLIHWVCQRCIQIVVDSHLQSLTASTVKRVMREFGRGEALKYAPLQEATRLIEDDPDLLRCVLLLLQQHTVPTRELPLPLSPDLDPLYLTGVIRKVEGEHYQLRNDMYRQHLAEHFHPGRVGHLFTMAGRWDAAVDYLESSIQAGNLQYRPDLLAATINSMYAAEGVPHAAHYLVRGLVGAFGAEKVQVWFATEDQDLLSRVAGSGQEDHSERHDAPAMRVAADSLEARAYRESESLRGTELDGRIERAVPLVIGNDKAIGVVTVVGRQGTAEPTLQRETDLELTGYLHQAARAMHDVHTREDQLLRIAKLEQQRTAQELRMAREIQESFLPEACPALPGWEFAADWRAAREVGGDFYDFVRVDDEHVGLVIADVSDKGVPAALFMSLSWTLLRVAASESTAPAKVLERMNELLMTESRSGMFLTLFYGVLNWRTGHLTYARAGHNPPILFRAQVSAPASHTAIAQHQAAGDTQPRRTRRLEQTVVTLMPDGTALGVQDGLTWAEEQVQMRPGDILILYTDGVTEPINPRGVEFGEERLVEAVRINSLRPCAEIVDLIGESVARFVGDQAQFDDYTLVGLKREALPQG